MLFKYFCYFLNINIPVVFPNPDINAVSLKELSNSKKHLNIRQL